MAAFRWAAVWIALAASAPAQAHHSAAMYDRSTTMAVSGTVREFRWASPHCRIRLVGPGGEWRIEMRPPYDLYRSGWRPLTLRAGDKLTVVISRARDGSRSGLFVSAARADGAPIGAGWQAS
jgi:hypothetical protein